MLEELGIYKQYVRCLCGIHHYSWPAYIKSGVKDLKCEHCGKLRNEPPKDKVANG